MVVVVSLDLQGLFPLGLRGRWKCTDVFSGVLLTSVLVKTSLSSSVYGRRVVGRVGRGSFDDGLFHNTLPVKVMVPSTVLSGLVGV